MFNNGYGDPWGMTPYGRPGGGGSHNPREARAIRQRTHPSPVVALSPTVTYAPLDTSAALAGYGAIGQSPQIWAHGVPLAALGLMALTFKDAFGGKRNKVARDGRRLYWMAALGGAVVVAANYRAGAYADMMGAGYGDGYGALSLEAQIGRVQVKLNRTTNQRRRRRLQAKLQRLQAKARRVQARAGAGVRSGISRLRPQRRKAIPRTGGRPVAQRPSQGGGLFPGLRQRLSRRQRRLRERLRRRQMRDQARQTRKGFKRQTDRDSGMPQDSWSMQAETPAYMESGDQRPGGGFMDPGGMASDQMLPESAADAAMMDYGDEGLPWGKIALGLGIVVALSAGVKARRKPKAKAKAKPKAKPKAGPRLAPPRPAL